MNETTILLAPAPKAKADFLVTVEPIGGGPGGGDLPFEITLDSYTRDKWGCAAPPSGDGCWGDLWLKSVDGRRKLPGFLKYLRDRKKSAFGRFDAVSEDGSARTRAVFVVPFDQPTPPPGLLEGDNTSVDDAVFCRCALDERRVEGLHRPQRPPPQQQKEGRPRHPPGRAQVHPAAAAAAEKKQAPAPAPSARAGKAGGLLGGLLGAQRRTNTHLNVVPAQKKKDAPSEDGAFGGVPAGTSGAAISKFRSDMEQKLLDFQKSAQTALKVEVKLADVIRDLPPDQKPNVTMDVLKYVVYEQAEEIGEDKWVAAKEPTDFLDECIVAVYKEGHVPPEVLEEMNKGELPDEIRQQQRGMQEARVKEEARKQAKRDALLQQMTVGRGAEMDMDFQQLNTQKRDRRTIEEIQRDAAEEAKRQRVG